MLIRIEFEEHKSPKLPWLVRLCKKFPAYKVIQDDGLTIHSIEFTEKEIDQFRAIHAILYGLLRVAYYVDGRLLPKDELFMRVDRAKKDQHWDRWISEKTRDERTRSLFHPRPNDAFLERLKKNGLFGNSN